MNVINYVGVAPEYTYKMLKQALNMFCDDLKIKKIPKLIIKSNPPHSGWVGSYDVANHEIWLYMSELKKYHPFITIAHECRHAFQFENGLFVYKKGYYVWKDDVWTGVRINLTDYRFHPWEQDAFNYERDIVRQLDIHPPFKR